MKIAFLTLGCKLNYAETSTYERGFLQAGWEVVPWNRSDADVYLVNTCSVTHTADGKCRNIIRKCHRTAPGAAIVVTGCYAELKRGEVAAIEGVRLVFGAKEKSRVVADTLSLLSGAKVRTDDSYKTRSLAEEYRDISSETLPAFSTGERTRSFLKVQDGCNNFCAYCTVPYARGESRNIPICELVKQAGAIAAAGVREIVLTGVNTGDFGRTTGESFLDLLKALDRVEGIERYRISSIEPNLLTDEIIDWIASGTKFLPHFHIPLQVGNDELLRKVGRRYDTALFASRIDRIRARMERPDGPEVFFGIDVIVGLPGETEEKFLDTYRFLAERIRPAFLHIFPYSKRPGTRAAAMPDQVPEPVKAQRVARLEALCKQLHDSFVARHSGKHGQVLWESDRKDGKMAGYTGNYIRVERPFDPARINTLEDILL
ncbi:MAG: tRNA (N(6)-L-threonylcarbamoyladenosine(37)-C(2))-methylthiotransferase MtaB [Bacteroidales bacterium]|nr:tRNA (N(6)-L-threonylcarbamoyladenosine(37)-C(2))-methylthiotransferase MtaB [Bacteroidales bacterium]